MPDKIYLDCERMKYSDTGLYHFCQQLGNAIIREVGKESESICFYLPKSRIGIFGAEQQYKAQHFMHKHLFPGLSGASVWHCTFQGSNYFPVHSNAKIVLTIHDLNFLYDSNLKASMRQKHIARLQKKIDRADHVVAISYYVLEDLRNNLRLENKSVSVIYNGCNIEESSDIRRPELSIESPFLFTIGTIAEKKNFHVLPSLLQDNDLILVIAGTTQCQEYLQRIKMEAIKFGVKDRVILTGPISENDKK